MYGRSLTKYALKLTTRLVLAQGGAQAVEDSVSVAMVLTPETPGSEVAERFQLYDRIRRERATTIQDQTRINAMDEEKRPKSECA